MGGDIITTYGVTDSGFVIKPLDVLIAEAAESSTTLFGTNVDTSVSSPLGKINSTVSAELAIFWEKMNETYLAAFLDSASGENLDKIVYPLGINRKPAVRSTGFVAFTGTEGTTIPGATTVKTVDDVPIEFKTDASLVLTEMVTNGEFTANTTGWTLANAATLSSVVGGKDGNCLQILCDGSDDPYAYQTITVQANHFYNLSVFANEGTAATYNVEVYDESNSANIYLSGDLTETAGDWSEEVSEVIEMPDDCTSVTVKLIHRATAAAATTMLFDTCTLVHASAAITAVSAGIAGDVAAGTITSLESPISGITSVTNPNATEDGAAEETDVALRIRTKQSIGAGGKATLNAIVAEVLEVDGVSSVTIEENETDTDYTDLLTNSGFTSDTSSWTLGNAATLASVSKKLDFTSGGTHEVIVGDTLTGETGGATAVVSAIILSGGTWAGGDAAGTFYFSAQTGVFEAETLKEAANLNVCNVASDSTDTGGTSGNALLIICDGSDDPYAHQAATVVAGDNYIFNVYCKAGDEATYAIKIYDVSNAGYIYESAELEETAVDWTTAATKSFTAPSGCTSVRIELYQIATAGAGTTFFFDTAILDGLPPHSVRVSVSGGTDADVAQALLDSVAAGIRTYGDESGNGTIDNGQSFERHFDRPVEILIYVSATITSDDTYVGDEAVETAIISYLGGVDADTVTHVGIGAGADVIFYEVVSAIMDVVGVTNAVVYIDTTVTPVASSDLTISTAEVSYTTTAAVVVS